MKNKQPIVSICCAAFNHESYIRNTIEGFLMQKTNFPIEIIIHDDASIDNTAEIVKQYAEQRSDLIIPIFQTVNQYSQGIKPWANFVFPKARGKYIALCEGDDYWTDPTKLQKQVDFLEANPDYGMVSGDVELIDGSGSLIPANQMLIKQREKRKPAVDFFDLLETNLINTLTVCARADIMKELAERVVKENLWFVYDHWFWLHIAMDNKIWVSDEKLAAYRVHSSGVSHQKGFFDQRKYLIKKDALTQALKHKKLAKHKVLYLLAYEWQLHIKRKIIKYLKSRRN